jgi:hypothetical protein
MLTSDQGVLQCSNFATELQKKSQQRRYCCITASKLKASDPIPRITFSFFCAAAADQFSQDCESPRGSRIACYWVIFPRARADAAN